MSTAQSRLNADIIIYKKVGASAFVRDSNRVQEIQAELERRRKATETVHGITLAKTGVLDRTVADIVRGKSSAPVSQLNPEQQRQLKVQRLNVEARSGSLTNEEYQKRLAEIEGRTAELKQERTQRFGRIATIAGKSETTKQDEARAIAATQGVAIGTISSSGSASVSQNSQVAQVSGIQRFVESQRPPPSTINTVSLEEKLTLDNRGEIPQSQGPIKPNYNYLVSLTENFGPERKIPGGSLDFIYGNEKERIGRFEKKDNLIESFGDSLYSSLRYSDLVESGEIKKPEGLALLPYYASSGLKVFYNIPLSLSGQKTYPTFSEEIFDTGFQLVTKGRTKTHDPIGDYIRKDPIRTLVQLPAEAALIVAGSKVASAGTTAFKKYSPIQYQAKQILTNEGKTATVIRSITVSGKPVISLQSGTIQKGFNPAKIPYQDINVSTREGFEGALGTGIEKEIFYSPKALSSQVSRGLIPEIAQTRATAWVDAVYQAKGVVSKGGFIGETPIEGLTAKQTKSIFNVVTKEQGKTIEQLHGSIGTRAAVPESVQQQAGSALLPKDIDIIPRGKNLPRTADELVQKFARSFPLEPGQRLKIVNLRGKEDANRALELYDPTTKEPRKILEVVLRKSDESKYGIGKGDRILNIRIPTKPTKLKDWDIKVSTADYQLLTNVKQALAYQKGSVTKFDIYTSSGRSKDIVRGYWNLKGKAVFAGGEEGKRLDKKAEYIRSLYPGLEFTDVKPEKVLIYSSQTSRSATKPSITDNLLSQSSKATPRPELERISKDESVSFSQTAKPKITSTAGSSMYAKPKPLTYRLLSSMGSSRDVSRTNRMLTPSTTRSLRKQSQRDIPKAPSRTLITTPPSKKPTIKEPPSIKLIGPPSTIPPTAKPPPKPPVKIPPSRPPTLIQSRYQDNKITMSFTRKKPIIPAMLDIKNTTKKAPGIFETGHDFLGWTKVAEIGGARTTTKDIDVGDARTAKLYREDLLSTKKRYKKSDTKNALSLKKSNSKFSLF